MALRKITVEEHFYLYKTTCGFGLNTDIATFEITIFLKDFKQTPLKISFTTWEDLCDGNPLNTGIKLTRLSNQQTEVINLNRPKYIRECILYGLNNGWNGKNKLESVDGLEILESLGYDVSGLHPKEGFTIAHGKEYPK
ncbi:hypothetical protein [Flavobacterium sp. CSZ]|uniref:hypothetical protein n=1 Tax=Flavobacterium sp. CSZ TaxID=2783791 RepID=UPI00188B7751|nr:hypothetical protein [Flavobacterium sp. CSZ]MBF4486733.1 hypothetical protein [Flavobacterium sp. CSZ]